MCDRAATPRTMYCVFLDIALKRSAKMLCNLHLRPYYERFSEAPAMAGNGSRRNTQTSAENRRRLDVLAGRGRKLGYLSTLPFVLCKNPGYTAGKGGGRVSTRISSKDSSGGEGLRFCTVKKKPSLLWRGTTLA